MQHEELQIEVTLDIFSGRPNPKWTLSPKQVEELVGKLDELRLPAAKAVTPPGLGYRGVIITNFSEDHRLPEQLTAYQAVIHVLKDREITYYEDINHIEEWLLAQARELGYGKVLDQFRQSPQ